MNLRYYHTPQFKVYDKIGIRWIPHLMFMNNPNFRSEICNTDCYGLRFNSKKYVNAKKESIFDININRKKSIVVGSSSIFGVGATLDEKTIPAILSNNSDQFFFNFGGRAFNGFQEIILAQLMINKINDIKKILLFSGMPDIYMAYNIKYDSSFPGPFFFKSYFFKVMDELNLSFKRKLIKFLLPNLNIDHQNITTKELAKFLFNFKKAKQNDQNFIFPKINLENIISRNIKLWKILSRSINTELIFFFPPFLPWSKKEYNYTKEEKEISTYITSIDDPNNTAAYRAIEKDYEKLVKLFQECCKKNEIKFYDCNSIFQSEEYNKKWLFVDKVHLTDYGNKIISEYILKKI